MRYLITGGCGFLGANLAHAVLRDSRGSLVILDNLSRLGADKNLAWLRSAGEFSFVHADIRSASDVEVAIAGSRPNVIFHLAGQVAMTTSLANPRLDFETNALGTLNVLEGTRRHAPDAVIVYSSTNKVYGDLEYVRFGETPSRYIAPEYPDGFPESLPLDFRTPYGASKGSADQYVLDYHRSFGLHTTVFRHSSMYGARQFASVDQGWIGWFCERALEQIRTNGAPFTISGTGKQVRDVLHADDMTALYFAAAEKIGAVEGRAFNIGGGMTNSLSLTELFDLLGQLLGGRLRFQRTSARESDQKVFVADVTAIKSALGWEPRVEKLGGIQRMIEWLRLVQ